MKTSGRTRTLLICAGALIATALAAAQQPSAPNGILTAGPAIRLPVDPQVTRGALPNGLRYYIRPNRKPEQRAELRLVVRAGSVLEDADQQGLAHVIEHLAFDGTLHFPKQSVLAFLTQLGEGIGPDANATTGFDETVYRLRVPTNQPGVLDRALEILQDWAGNISFDPDEIDRERSVVTEEWRLRRGAGARMQDINLPILLAGSRYADRLPIGKLEVIQHFAPDRLKQFYADWYRPDLMAVIAVGDFNAADVENLIKARFRTIPMPASPRPRPAYDVPDHTGTVYAIVTDKEVTSTSIQVENLLPLTDMSTVGAYRQIMVDRLFAGMLAARYGELAQAPGAPFIGASTGRGLLPSRTKVVATLSATVTDTGIERGLDALLTEIERVVRFGFTATELDRQKQNLMRAYERAIAERDSRDSTSRADELTRHVVQQEPVPRVDDEYALHQRFLPQITLEEVSRVATTWFPGDNRFVLVTAPDKPGLVIPDARQLAAVIAGAATRDVKPYVDSVGSGPLLDAPPAPGAIAKTTARSAIGVTEWELSNGVRVVLKPTTVKEDEILLNAFSPGGTSLIADQDASLAAAAVGLVAAGGVGKFTASELRKVLTGRVASVGPYINDYQEGLSGSSSRKDLETLFQLIYLRMTQPRVDAAAYAAQLAQAKSALANRDASPDAVFRQVLTTTLSQDHPRSRPPAPAVFEAWTSDRALAYYRDRFADASGFTFVFVGSFDLPTITPLVERYLGALPSLQRRESWKDVGIRTPAGVVEKTVEKGLEPKSQVAILFTGPMENDQPHRVALTAVSKVLQSKLADTIRRELGGTYSITATAGVQLLPAPTYTVAIQWACDPKRTEELVQRVFQDVEWMKTSTFAVNSLKDVLVREYDGALQRNDVVLGQMIAKYQTGGDVAEIWSVPDYYNRLDLAAVQAAARTYLDTRRYVRVTLVPEKK